MRLRVVGGSGHRPPSRPRFLSSLVPRVLAGSAPSCPTGGRRPGELGSVPPNFSGPTPVVSTRHLAKYGVDRRRFTIHGTSIAHQKLPVGSVSSYKPVSFDFKLQLTLGSPGSAWVVNLLIQMVSRDCTKHAGRTYGRPLLLARRPRGLCSVVRLVVRTSGRTVYIRRRGLGMLAGQRLHRDLVIPCTWLHSARTNVQSDSEYLHCHGPDAVRERRPWSEVSVANGLAYNGLHRGSALPRAWVATACVMGFRALDRCSSCLVSYDGLRRGSALPRAGVATACVKGFRALDRCSSCLVWLGFSSVAPDE